MSLRVLADAKGADSLSGWREKFSQFVPQRQSMAIDPNGIAHIAIHGTLFNKEAPYFVAGFGGTDYEEVLQDIAVASKEAKGIFLTVDSGGGHACGNDKVAKAISQCPKPVFAYTDGMCCSAAYAIASGASYICASADATVGSIGTILPLMDVSGLWQALGVKPDYITNKEGTLKTAGYPPSQNDDERAALQAETQSYFELFKSHVLAHRNIEKVDELSGMVRDILDTSKVQDLQEEEKQKLYAGGEIGAVLQEYAMQIADKKLEVTDSIPEDCMLFMSRNTFQKVWSNLIGNAVQYTEQGGQITIAADTDKIWIENSCTPLTEEQLAYIYEPFYRVDDTRAASGGNGLGLYVVWELLKKEGFRYVFEPVEDGMRFTIFL